MTDQVTEIVPIEADEVEAATPAPHAPSTSQQSRKELRMEVDALTSKIVVKRSKAAIAALVLGALVFWTFGFTALPAIITGHVGLLTSRRGGRGRWMAIIGLVLGYGTLLVYGLLLLAGLLYAIYS